MRKLCLLVLIVLVLITGCKKEDLTVQKPADAEVASLNQSRNYQRVTTVDGSIMGLSSQVEKMRPAK